jgi:hypothetical protein
MEEDALIMKKLNIRRFATSNPVIPPKFYASDADIKINSDVKVGKMSLKEIDNVVSALFDLIYPVGSIYYTNNANFNPNVSFSGTWQQIKDTFLLAAGDTYVGGTSGGEATHKLTVNEMPSHNHNLPGRVLYYTSGGGDAFRELSGRDVASNNSTSFDTGGGQAHNNMPPYIVVYVWKRVS